MVIGKPLFTVEQIQRKVQELADRITRDYEGRELVMVCILKGAFMFFSDLVRHIRVPMTVDFVSCSSYVKSDSVGEVKLHQDLREQIKDKHVILVEDIADSGLTLNYLREHFLQRGPSSLKICVLLDKRERRLVDVPIDYAGFPIPDKFVVGYGLDYSNMFRNLPYIAVFKKST
ncbi:MAG: hypoxanthine phosphoribosyltransferase [Nitrospiraceae bacterium]|nr:hypoxanthine phosphoribosyltransferase [Nitrospiraceae bacterium]